MAATGRGHLDLTTWDLHYDLVTELTDSVGIAGCQTMDRVIGTSIPVILTGNITAPEVRPDFGEVIVEAVEDKLEDRLRERLEDLFNR